jgi:thiol:disulfide interchange protein
MWRYLLAWLPMVAIAVANGALRDLWYGKRMSELTAHQLSTAFGFVLLGAYIWMVVRLWPPASVEHAWAVGALWFVLTLAFEFLFGRYVLRKSWQHLFHDYNLLAGRVWVLIPLWVAVAPYLFSRLGA